MKIEVSLSPALYPFRTISLHHTTVAIDLLRATTAVCAAFQAGCTEVVPLDSLDALADYKAKGFCLAAERGGLKVEGAQFGNSPTEYLQHDMNGIRLAYSTTNGTVSLLKAADADITYAGAFANISALTARLAADNRDTVLLCSGWHNDFCIEDTLVAGAIIDRLAPDASLCGDAAYMALSLWKEARTAPAAYCQRCSHVHRLAAFGAEADVAFAFVPDTCPLVPVLHNGSLRISPQTSSDSFPITNRKS